MTDNWVQVGFNSCEVNIYGLKNLFLVRKVNLSVWLRTISLEHYNPEVFTQPWISILFSFLCWMHLMLTIPRKAEAFPELSLYLSYLKVHLLSCVWSLSHCTQGSVAPVKWQLNLEPAGLLGFLFYFHVWASLAVWILPFHPALSVLLEHFWSTTSFSSQHICLCGETHVQDLCVTLLK